MIYIVRHGETNWNVEGRYQGRIDIELNENGFNQAKQISEELKNIEFNKVFSSPLKRALQTDQIISNKDIIVDNRLIERSNGDLEGKLKSECNINIDFNNPNENRLNIENIIDFRKRIKDFFDEITSDYQDENILVVTHAGVGIYARCYFEGEPLDGDYSKYKLKNGEVLKYDVKVKEKLYGKSK